MPYENGLKIMKDKDVDYLSLFTNFSERKFNSVWIGSKKKKIELPLTETTKVHPVPGMDSTSCVEAGTGPWDTKIYHFIPNLPPSSNGDEIHSEYFVDFQNFEDTLDTLFKISESFKHLL
jgi:hypothetical protein